MSKGKELIYTIRVIDKSKVVIDELGQEVETLEQAFVQINGEIQKTDTLLEGTASSFEKQIRTLKQQRDSLAKNSVEYGKYNAKIAQVEAELRKLTTTTKSQDQVNADMIANTGLASNTIVEFGRTISDAPFGIIGVTNNLSNLANNFEILSGKVGGTQNVLTLLKRQLMKGGAFVLAIQGVLALLTFFRDDIEKLVASIFGGSKKIKEGMVSIKDEAIASRAALERYLQILDDVTASQQDQATALDALLRGNKELNDALDEQLISGEKRRELSKEFFELQLDFSTKSNELNDQLEKFNAKDLKAFERKKGRIATLKQENIELQKTVDSRRAEGTLTVSTEARVKNIIRGNDIRIGQMEATIAKRDIDLDLLNQVIDGERQLNEFVDERIKKFGDIEPIDDNLFESLNDDVLEDDRNIIERLLDPNDELKDGFDAIRFAEESGLEGALNDLNNFMKEYQGENALERINLAQQEALNELNILYDAQEEELGSRIGFNEDVTKVEQFYAEQRAKISEKENQAKAKSLRVSAQAAVQVGKLLQQLAGENKTLAIAGVVVEKAGAIAKIIANKNIADAAALPLLSNPLTASLGTALLTTNKITATTGVIATTASAVQAIKEIRNPESATSSGAIVGNAPTPLVQAPSFNVVGATQTSQLAQTIAGAEEKPIKAFVVESEITTAQQLARSVIVNSSI